MTPEQQLDQLQSAHEIRELAYRYAYAHDACDPELLLSLWEETETPLQPPAIDIHRVRAVHIPALKTRGPSILFVGNHIIEFEGSDEARGIVYCLVQLEVDGAFVDQSVVYGDRYLRREGTWRFVHRRHVLWYGIERDRHPFDQPAADWPARAVGRGTAVTELRSELGLGR